MIADSFNNCGCTGVTDTETLACDTADKCFSAGCTIEGNVTDDDVLIFFVFHACRSIDNQFSTGKSFSKVVIGISD